ncbi:glycoside hydrolase family 16 protein [Mycena belliarum]|uniref:Glycoside hydrolase family 16 protein n=1 Tax=Mycena belliarum TaxID=1033014 RepID=A0AAD6XR82_9AGAR|nr:glycoside hydrolase family 16 protein [Mycena belliae]
MARSAPAVFGVLALAASVSASHNEFKRMSQHARVAQAPTWKRAAVSGVAYYGYQNKTMNACGTYSSDTDMIIGVGPAFYGDMGTVSSKCGEHITIALTSDKSKSIDVTLSDACKDCGSAANVYLSTAAFKALSGGSLDAGVLDVTWSFNSQSSLVSEASSPEGLAASTPKAEATSTADAKTTEATTAKAAPTTSDKAKTTSTKAAPTTSSKKATATGKSNEGWKLKNKLEGQAFLDFFKYDTNANDNGGAAQYVNGISQGLAYTSGSQVILAVDNAQNVGARNALRMVSKNTFNAKDMNLFVFDIAQMPAVCGTWPAVWFTGANWPFDGEIDVVEGVSLYKKNIYSVHTGSGCTIPPAAISTMKQVSLVKAGATNCDANVDTAGCGFSDESTASFGPDFNKAGGGVFALQFDTTGVKTWFFQAGKVPSDIKSFAPNPSTWGAPRMDVPSLSCDPTTYFRDLMMVVDTNLAGTFTEGVWAVDGAGGQGTSCKTQTGVATAAEFVKNHGSEFGDAAQWKMNGFYIYSQ